MKRAKVLAVVAHPDDIELSMAGTLFLLKERGCALHYLAVANGSCGTETLSYEEIVRIRREEARAASAYLGAEFHEALVNDLEIFHTDPLVRRMAAIVRLVAPDIVLTHPLEDYMEDHMNAARLACSAAFIRSSGTYRTDPPRPPVRNEVAIYHVLPHGLRDRTRNPVLPELFVDIGSVIGRKREMVSFHRSQEAWLSTTQGAGALALSAEIEGREIGRMSGRFELAEGWTRHLHIGYSQAEIDPLGELLGGLVLRR